MKLSDKQMEVVKLLRGGAVMFVPHSYFVSPKNKVIIRNGSDYKELNKTTFISLRSKGIIYQDKYKSSDSSVYKLTELGKTIKL